MTINKSGYVSWLNINKHDIKFVYDNLLPFTVYVFQYSTINCPPLSINPNLVSAYTYMSVNSSTLTLHLHLSTLIY